MASVDSAFLGIDGQQIQSNVIKIVSRTDFVTCVVNFINILRTRMLFWQLFSSYIYVEKAAETICM